MPGNSKPVWFLPLDCPWNPNGDPDPMHAHKFLASLIPLTLVVACASPGKPEPGVADAPEASDPIAGTPDYAGVDFSDFHGGRVQSGGSGISPASRPGVTPGPIVGHPGRNGLAVDSRGGRSLDSRARAPRMSLPRELRATTLRGFQRAETDSLRTTVEQVALLTGLPLIVSEAAEQAAFDEGALFAYDLSNRITAHNLLNLIAADAGDEVEWTVKHEAVLFTTSDRARGELAIRVHDISAHVFAQTDFLAPRIDRLRLLEDIEDDDGGGPFGGIGESVQRYTESDLESLVQENIAVGTWDQDGVSIRGENGKLIVVHSEDVQRQVRRFLAELSPF